MARKVKRDDAWIRKGRDEQIESDSGDGIPVDELRIVLLGKTGSGKSATANTLIGQKVFESRLSASSVTSVCSSHKVQACGKTIMVVDTPGLFDTTYSAEKTKIEIAKCIGITAPGPHAFLVVLTLSRQTEEEQNTVSEIATMFGFEIFRYGIILFTGKDELTKQNVTLERYLETFPSKFRRVLDDCQNRCIAIDNTSENSIEKERKSLLDIIMKMVTENKGSFYTNTDIQIAESVFKRAVKNIYTREMEIMQKKPKTLWNHKDVASHDQPEEVDIKDRIQEDLTSHDQPEETDIKNYLSLTDQEKMNFKGKIENIITRENIRMHLRNDCEQEGETHEEIQKNSNCSIL